MHLYILYSWIRINLSLLFCYRSPIVFVVVVNDVLVVVVDEDVGVSALVDEVVEAVVEVVE